MNRVRDRIGDKRVLGRVKAFLRAGILSEEGFNRETQTSSAVCRIPFNSPSPLMLTTRSVSNT